MKRRTSPLEAPHGGSVRDDGGSRGHVQANIAVSSGVDVQGLSQGPDVHPEDDNPPPAWQLQTKRALSDLWNLSELEDSRKRMNSGQAHTMPLSVPLPSLPM